MAIISSKQPTPEKSAAAGMDALVDALIEVGEVQVELPLDTTAQTPKKGRRSVKANDDAPVESLPLKTSDELLKGDRAVEETQKQEEKIRPQTIQEYVGQKDLKDVLDIAIRAAKARGECLDHLLLYGPPGLGKTTMSLILAGEMGVNCKISSAPSLERPRDIVGLLMNLQEGDVLFIDEIHRLPRITEEILYPAMEDFRVDITLGDGLNARTINMKLQPFTLIGATTRSGMLTAPLRDRFVNREHLDFYTDEELATIVTRNARKLRTEISPEAAQEIAIRSRGTPRKANNWLRWTRDFADVRANGKITLEVARAALRMKGVDDAGLEEQDRKYLQTIIRVFGGGPAGVQALGHTMNIPADTLEDEVEPFLLREGFIQRTPRGRMITAKAMAHLGVSQKQNPKQPRSGSDNAEQRELFD